MCWGFRERLTIEKSQKRGTKIFDHLVFLLPFVLMCVCVWMCCWGFRERLIIEKSQTRRTNIFDHLPFPLPFVCVCVF